MKASLVFAAASSALLAIAGPLDYAEPQQKMSNKDMSGVWDLIAVSDGTAHAVPDPNTGASGSHKHRRAKALCRPKPQHSYSSLAPTTISEPTSAPLAPAQPAVVPVIDKSYSKKPFLEQPTTVPVETIIPSTEPTTTAPATKQPTATGSTDASSTGELAQPVDFQTTALYHHNIHRLNHSATPLSWSDEIAGYAEESAKKCVFAHDLTPGGGGYGQNLAMWASSSDAEALGSETAMAQASTNMWYNGEFDLWPASDYGKANPDMSKFEAWGHFSQLLWAGSEQLGCYSNFCEPGTMFPNMGAWYTVCNYSPAGNMGGEYGTNVLPPLNHAVVMA